jgi:hypothetical protein
MQQTNSFYFAEKTGVLKNVLGEEGCRLVTIGALLPERFAACTSMRQSCNTFWQSTDVSAFRGFHDILSILLIRIRVLPKY